MIFALLAIVFWFGLFFLLPLAVLYGLCEIVSGIWYWVTRGRYFS